MTDKTERIVNIPLLRKAVEWAEAEAAKPVGEGEWDQRFWVTTHDEATQARWGILAAQASVEQQCGTCYCIAGWVVATQDHGPGPSAIVDRATEILGLSLDGLVHPLFAANNSIEDVRRIAEEIAGERL